jgi:putative tricarboxylic transport membrane protein
MYDLVTCVCFGFIGYLMMRYDYPVSPMVLAQILGFMMESNFRRSLVMSSGDPMILVTRPIALTILILAAFATVTAIRRQRIPRFRRRKPHPKSRGGLKPLPRISTHQVGNS